MIRLEGYHQGDRPGTQPLTWPEQGDQEVRLLDEAPESRGGQRLTRRLTQSLKDQLKVPRRDREGPLRNLYLEGPEEDPKAGMRGDGQASAQEDSVQHGTGTFET
ncbi:hypothetical protein GWK47_039710 [Chionoecetes opilio]|uniref:Uncharacterized protein n=1 Tax=Chionoecetes opilio TaxID=41210 RepID=A0A8J4YCN2_CHIOP|nr:hypothetical protein GWK47_039710 [Chionoecetes opilio]